MAAHGAGVAADPVASEGTSEAAAPATRGDSTGPPRHGCWLSWFLLLSLPLMVFGSCNTLVGAWRLAAPAKAAASRDPLIDGSSVRLGVPCLLLASLLLYGAWQRHARWRAARLG